MTPQTSDPAIDEIREIRHQISARYSHDPARLIGYLMQYQLQFQDRFVQNMAPVTSQAMSHATLNSHDEMEAENALALEAIREGLADAETGRVEPIDVVLKQLCSERGLQPPQ